MPKREDEEAEVRLYWHLVAAYVLEAVGRLPADRAGAIDRLTAEWRSVIGAELGIDQDYVKRLYSLATDRMEESRAVLFIIRGFGCPEPVELIREVLG